MYHEWRSLGARLAAPKGHETHITQTLELARILQIIKKLGEPFDIWSTMNKAQSFEMLQNIITTAVSLDLTMQQQRAYFVLLGAKELHRDRYNSGNMEVRFGKVLNGQRQFVTLLIGPLLLKRGNSEGKEFNTSIVIEKAEVDVEVPRRRLGYGI
jgi:hypothetical protein